MALPLASIVFNFAMGTRLATLAGTAPGKRLLTFAIVINLAPITLPYRAVVVKETQLTGAYAMFAQYGLDSLFNDWRERLVKSAHAQAAESGADIRVWDFSGFTPHHCEAVPPPDDRKTQLKWYWEGGHFKKELGDLVLDQLFAPDAAALATLPQMGRVITPNSLAAKVQQDQIDESRCRKELPGLLAEVQGVAAKIKPKTIAP